MLGVRPADLAQPRELLPPACKAHEQTDASRARSLGGILS